MKELTSQRMNGHEVIRDHAILRVQTFCGRNCGLAKPWSRTSPQFPFLFILCLFSGSPHKERRKNGPRMTKNKRKDKELYFLVRELWAYLLILCILYVWGPECVRTENSSLLRDWMPSNGKVETIHIAAAFIS